MFHVLHTTSVPGGTCGLEGRGDGVVDTEEEVEDPREKSEPRPLISGLYSATVMLSPKETVCGVCESKLFFRSDESE